MGKPHKHADLRLLARTGLGDAEIARLAKVAADQAGANWSTVRLERAEPGRLVFSVRGPGGLVEQMVFALEAATDGSSTKVQSSVTRYKQSQSTFAGFIPMGQKKMLGLASYRKWIANLSAALRSADPRAHIDVNGPLTASIGELL
jgi:hypothetical protein